MDILNSRILKLVFLGICAYIVFYVIIDDMQSSVPGYPEPQYGFVTPADCSSTACQCKSPVLLENTVNPDHVVGLGTKESCTHDALAFAVAQGGTIVFDCGKDDFVTINVESELELRPDIDTIIDGGGKIALDGGRANRVFNFKSDGYRSNMTRVVLQRLTIQNGKAPATQYIPQDPSNTQCAWGYKDGAGGAVRFQDGRLHVLDSIFKHNEAAPVGPDTGGGAIFASGAMEVIVVGSTFVENVGSNGGALGLLQSDGFFYNSVFEKNAATGEGQNYSGASGCPEFNHALQGGAGGNGGAIAIDGRLVQHAKWCDVVFRENRANELATVFRTPNKQRGISSFEYALFEDNYAGAGGGAIWMNDMSFGMRNSAVIGNQSDGPGAGININQGSHGNTILLENTTIQGNIARNSLGGGLMFNGSGIIRNTTFAENQAIGGDGFFGGAIVAHGRNAGQLRVQNTIFWNNFDEHEWTPMTCSIGDPKSPAVFIGSGNVQWPAQRNGPIKINDTPCTPGISFTDAMLSEVAYNGGLTPTMIPGNEFVLELGHECPALDQRGESRQENICASGAVEVR